MKPQTQEGGFALVESLIAILIFALGILTLVGLQSASMRNTTQSQFRLEASLVANQQLGLVWADIPGKQARAESKDVDSLPQGRRVTTVDGDKVTITVTWIPPGQTEVNKYTTVALVNTNKKKP